MPRICSFYNPSLPILLEIAVQYMEADAAVETGIARVLKALRFHCKLQLLLLA